jgi:NAD(P)-dependent dehydrogenase (short-subunit alcohol dehydrogenase family)
MKRILITGASRGIGLEICTQLIADGHDVLATYRSEKTANSLLDLNDSAKNLHTFEMDVNSSDSVKSAMSEIAKRFSSLDLVFNNAGILDWSPLDEVSSDAFRSIYETNVIGVFRVSEAAIPLLRNGNEPLIVNLSSRLGSIELKREFTTRRCDRLSMLESRSQYAH